MLVVTHDMKTVPFSAPLLFWPRRPQKGDFGKQGATRHGGSASSSPVKDKYATGVEMIQELFINGFQPAYNSNDIEVIKSTPQLYPSRKQSRLHSRTEGDTSEKAIIRHCFWRFARAEDACVCRALSSDKRRRDTSAKRETGKHRQAEEEEGTGFVICNIKQDSGT